MRKQFLKILKESLGGEICLAQPEASDIKTNARTENALGAGQESRVSRQRDGNIDTISIVSGPILKIIFSDDYYGFTGQLAPLRKFHSFFVLEPDKEKAIKYLESNGLRLESVIRVGDLRLFGGEFR